MLGIRSRWIQGAVNRVECALNRPFITHDKRRSHSLKTVIKRFILWRMWEHQMLAKAVDNRRELASRQ